MEDLTQRFYPSQLRGKLLNACADISAQALTSIDTIKKATGEDLLIYERKGADATTFRSYAKLLFSANQIPLNLDEKSDALYRRMLILVMDRKRLIWNWTRSWQQNSIGGSGKPFMHSRPCMQKENSGNRQDAKKRSRSCTGQQIRLRPLWMSVRGGSRARK